MGFLHSHKLPLLLPEKSLHTWKRTPRRSSISADWTLWGCGCRWMLQMEMGMGGCYRWRWIWGSWWTWKLIWDISHSRSLSCQGADFTVWIWRCWVQGAEESRCIWRQPVQGAQGSRCVSRENKCASRNLMTKKMARTKNKKNERNVTTTTTTTTHE